MDTNKMREQFEAQFIEEYVRVLGEGARELAAHTLAANPPLVSMSWWAWQASRESVMVQMPNRASDAYREEFDDVEGGSFNEAAYIRDVRKAIEAQGLRVAP
ncbi:TPA: hypothetical protein QEM39_003732 [Pseudomonas putida]|uniref:hypothetical protein n=1 Tax=Pseudomonas putida TaxID=303 RepID=UPI002363C8DF|nr:hypothetical protein [Pseudomonas putida]MDD2149948.1 hypothetical protein [Pseudomonas putida]HDS1682155.1 hypothetical protein [Pseudomonas putida]